jgi:acetyl esterase
MNNTVRSQRPPLGIRLLHAVGKEPNWSAMTARELGAFSKAENRKRASRLARVITGFPDRGAVIDWQEVALADRRLRVRVHRPAPTHNGANGHSVALPLVLHVHGGGFVGTAVQSDWVNSHLAARLPAVVVSVEHRLLAPDVSLTAAVDDGWEVLEHVIGAAPQWGIDATRAAVLGESTGAAITALAAIRAREVGLPLRAQVLVNPCVDLTSTMYDHGRSYAQRLRQAGTLAQVAEYPGATHAFLSMPGVVPQAKPARARIVEFLRRQLVG